MPSAGRGWRVRRFHQASTAAFVGSHILHRRDTWDARPPWPTSVARASSSSRRRRPTTSPRPWPPSTPTAAPPAGRSSNRPTTHQGARHVHHRVGQRRAGLDQLVAVPRRPDGAVVRHAPHPGRRHRRLVHHHRRRPAGVDHLLVPRRPAGHAREPHGVGQRQGRPARLHAPPGRRPPSPTRTTPTACCRSRAAGRRASATSRVLTLPDAEPFPWWDDARRPRRAPHRAVHLHRPQQRTRHHRLHPARVRSRRRPVPRRRPPRRRGDPAHRPRRPHRSTTSSAAATSSR